MQLFGLHAQHGDLLALSLVVGILVDDAIVEIENIVRHMRMGKTPDQAASKPPTRSAWPCVATTMRIVAVFLPVAFMPGMPGQFFNEFGITVVVAVLFSLLVARLVTPMMAAYFLKAHGQEPQRRRKQLEGRYLRWLRLGAGHRWITVASAPCCSSLRSSLSARCCRPASIPTGDPAAVSVSIELPPGTRSPDRRRCRTGARRCCASSPK